MGVGLVRPVMGEVCFVYENWRGEVSPRRVIPVRLYFGSCDWHPEKQWLLDGIDLDRNAYRTFAVAGIKDLPAGALYGVAGWAEYEAEGR